MCSIRCFLNSGNYIAERSRLIKRRKFPKIFFGWWTVIAGGFLALWGHGFHTYGFSALFKHISEDLHFDRAVTSVAAGIGRFEGGFEAPITGWITDRFGPRWIVLLGVSLISISLILMRFIDSLWAFYAVWGVMLGTGVNIALTLPMDVAITNWFIKKRGKALSVRMVFSGLSGVIVMPLVAALIGAVEWRMTCFIGGVVMAAVGIPLVWFFVKQHRPEYYGMLPDGATFEGDATDMEQMLERGRAYAAEVQEVEFTVKQAMKTRVYWLMILTQAVHSLIMPVMSIHCIPFLTDMEWLNIDDVQAAGMMTIWIAASLPARFAGGVIADRIKARNLRLITGGSYFLQALGVSIFLMNRSMPAIIIWFILYGIGQGGGMAANPIVRARFFGRKSFGSIAGLSRFFMTPIGVLGPIYAGWIYDTTGSYDNAFIQMAIMVGVSAVLALFILPPKPPTESTEILSTA